MNAELKRTFGQFNWQIPRIVASLPEGDDIKSLYESFVHDAREDYNRAPALLNLRYNPKTNSLEGSNIFIVSRLSELLEPSEIRTAIPSDDRHGDISRLVNFLM